MNNIEIIGSKPIDVYIINWHVKWLKGHIYDEHKNIT